MTPDRIALTAYRGPAGDHNDRAFAGSAALASGWARRLGIGPVMVGEPGPPSAGGWRAQLDAARPELRDLAGRYEAIYATGRRALTALGRCAAGLATLPVVLRHRPDTVVVWLDAHGDLNTPETSRSGYLGGMVLAAVLGLWESGFGGGLGYGRGVLVGARALDQAERDLLDDGVLAEVPPGPDLVDRLGDVIRDRPVYVHVDCDVLDPGLVPTEYAVPGGLSLDDLRAVAVRLARNPVLGLEVAELEGHRDGAPPGTGPLLDALQPVVDALAGEGALGAA